MRHSKLDSLSIHAVTSKLRFSSLAACIAAIRKDCTTMKSPEESRPKNKFSPFSPFQAAQYSETWALLQRLRESADALWSKANKKNLKVFSVDLERARIAIRTAGLSIEPSDYEELSNILRTFNSFYDGKEDLVAYLSTHPDVLSSPETPLNSFVADQIKSNRKDYERYNALIDRLQKRYYTRLTKQTSHASDPVFPTIVGAIVLLTGLGISIWAFSLGYISPSRRLLLLWILPLASAVAAVCFSGSLHVKGTLGKLSIAASGGLAAWLLSFSLLSKVPQEVAPLTDETWNFRVRVLRESGSPPIGERLNVTLYTDASSPVRKEADANGYIVFEDLPKRIKGKNASFYIERGRWEQAEPSRMYQLGDNVIQIVVREVKNQPAEKPKATTPKERVIASPKSAEQAARDYWATLANKPSFDINELKRKPISDPQTIEFEIDFYRKDGPSPPKVTIETRLQPGGTYKITHKILQN